jgi:hypothetical protein
MASPKERKIPRKSPPKVPMIERMIVERVPKRK